MDFSNKTNNLLFEITNELKKLNSSLMSISKTQQSQPEYLTLSEVMEQYPISRESLYRLKNADILKVSRLTERGKFLVERKHFEEVIKSNNV